MSAAPKKLFCFGYGYVAQALAEGLRAQDPSWIIAGTTRDLDKQRFMKNELGVQAWLFDSDHPLDDPLHAFEGTTHMLFSVPPDDNGDPAFNFHGEDIAMMDQLQWAGLLSTTAVYGDRDGGWVDEESEQRPTNKRGSRRSLAEAQWLSLHANNRLPVHIFRLAGIYGPGRSALDAVRAGNSRRINKPGHAFNRIHIDDIVQTLIASMNKPHPGRAYNVSDDEPSPSFEVIGRAADLLGMTPGPIIPFDEADQAPMARSFYLDNKRVNNERIKTELGVTLKYPSYREGLQACLEDEIANRTPAPIFMGGGGL